MNRTNSSTLPLGTLSWGLSGAYDILMKSRHTISAAQWGVGANIKYVWVEQIARIRWLYSRRHRRAIRVSYGNWESDISERRTSDGQAYITARNLVSVGCSVHRTQPDRCDGDAARQQRNGLRGAEYSEYRLGY